MSSLQLDYPQLLAEASRPYGGASDSNFRDLLGRDLDRNEKFRFAPVFSDLSVRSGHGPGPLFTGIPAFASGVEALCLAHTEAFGTGIDAAELTVDGSAHDDSLTTRLAARLQFENRRIWFDILRSEIRNILPALPEDGLATFLHSATPEDWTPPSGVRGSTIDAIDLAITHACRAVVIITKQRLNRLNFPGNTIETQAARCFDCVYLARCYRRTIRQGFETMLLHAGVVHADGEQCLSRASMRAWIKKQKAQEKWMSQMVVRDKHGEVKDRKLSDVAPSNEAKRSRLLAILTGIDTLALEAGLRCAMLTLTLPPEWHPSPSHGSCSWAGASHNPHAGACGLRKDWSAYLRDLANVDVRICGIRVVEAHKDGCPHVHCMIYYQAEDEMAILDRLASAYSVPSVRLRSCVVAPNGSKVTRKGVKYTLIEEHFEAATGRIRAGGGDSRRIEFARVNREISSAVSYVSKYVLKALQFDKLPLDDNEAATSPALISAAHASIWCYRRFSLFGVRGKLTSWDEMRRVPKGPENAHAGALWMCAREGDFAGYLRILGGLSTGGASKSDLSIRLTRSPRKTCYGDKSHSITGVRVLCGLDLLFSAITRTPGRFEIIEADLNEPESEPSDACFEIGIEVYTAGDPPF